MSARRPRDARRKETHHAFFSTSLGECAIAWTAREIAWIVLPELSPEVTRARAAAGSSAEAEPPSWVREAIVHIAEHLAGADADLSSIPLDLGAVPPFHRRVYEVTRAVARGEVRTYAEIAAAAGSPLATRAVGQALAKNPFPIVVPCHRVIAAGNTPGGFSAPGGLDTKARLLAIEGRALAVDRQSMLSVGEPPR